jgi:hypothetical protein
VLGWQLLSYTMQAGSATNVECSIVKGDLMYAKRAIVHVTLSYDT